MNRQYIRKAILNPFDDRTYLSKLPVVKYLKKTGELTFEKPVTFFTGENGTGKSTLIEALAICAGFNAEGGSRNFNFSTKSTESELCEHITLAKTDFEKDGFFLRAESFYNVASQVDDLELDLSGYGGTSLHRQSHGESFMKLVKNRFRGKGLYILDEPEAALSPRRQMDLISEIHRLVLDNSQFIIATHSPILMSYPDAEIFELSESGIEKVEYEQCEHYKVTRDFLNNPQQMLMRLLS